MSSFLGPIWVRFICKDGTESDTYHLRGGGYESLINCLQRFVGGLFTPIKHFWSRYVFLTRSAKADNLVLISDSRTDALEKSVGMLNLDKKDIVAVFYCKTFQLNEILSGFFLILMRLQ